MSGEEKQGGGHSHGGHSHGQGATHPGHGVAVEEGFVAALRPAGTERSELSRHCGKGKLLFLDLPSGIAGDMTISALVDLGVPTSVIESSVQALGLDGVQLSFRSGYAGAIGCTHFQVAWPEQDGERSYTQIVELIEASQLGDEEKELALRIFARLARAEAAVHRTTLDQVHFHEVGAVDAIVDIVGAASAFCYIGARVVASPVPLGRGFVHCRHGDLPLPAPATLNCLEGVPTMDSGLRCELVTPTGAAIVATVAEEFLEWPVIALDRIGWGAGTRGLPDRPNAMRAILGDGAETGAQLTHVLLEANVDDMTAEVAGYVLEEVVKCGALDAWIVPVVMKKARPGMVFSALASRESAALVTECILSETTTIGVRQTFVARQELSREVKAVETAWGKVRFKRSQYGAGAAKCKPEFEDCATIARREGLPLREVIEAVSRAVDSIQT